ncbi:MAG: hypothetical protein J7M26_06590 [Armatimonadetes bacterium]|nr:hypothetical protein [Armatimonadota bacterium]
MPRVHGEWFIVAALMLAHLAAIVSLSPPVPWVLLTLALVLTLMRTLRWAATTRRIPRRRFAPRKPRAGVTLISALVSLTILALASAMAVQVLTSLFAARRAQVAQAQALAAAATTLEQARTNVPLSAGAAAAKPYPAPLSLSAGPVAGTVTATAVAPLPGGGKLELTTFLPGKAPAAANSAGAQSKAAGGGSP